MNAVTMSAFINEMEKISLDKESILGPRQALQIAGGVKGAVRSVGKKLGLGGATKAKATLPKAAPKMVDPAAIKAETTAALKANPRLKAVTQQFPQSTQASQLRPGYSPTPTPRPTPARAIPERTAVPTVVGRSTSRPSITSAKAVGLGGAKHGPFMPSRSISAQQLRRIPAKQPMAATGF